jgi:hypothetical protein
MEGSNSSKKGKNNEDEKEKQRGKEWRSYF